MWLFKCISPCDLYNNLFFSLPFLFFSIHHDKGQGLICFIPSFAGELNATTKMPQIHLSCFCNRKTEPNGRPDKVRRSLPKQSQTCFGSKIGSLHLLRAWYAEVDVRGLLMPRVGEYYWPGSLSLLVCAKISLVFLVWRTGQPGHRGSNLHFLWSNTWTNRETAEFHCAMLEA